MNILVTGAKGFIGKNLCENLKNIRDGKDKTRPSLAIEDIYEYDVGNGEEELRAFCGKADFVFHLAGVNRPKDKAEFREGNGVRFGNYFYARVYLKGTSDGNGTLSADRNEIVVNLVKGEGFKLSLDMFDLQFRGAASIPNVDFLISEDDDAERGILVPGENVLLNGSNLWAETDAATRVRFTKVVDSGDAPVVEVEEFIARGPALLSFAYPQSLSAGRWSVEVLRTDANGTTRRSAPVEVAA